MLLYLVWEFPDNPDSIWDDEAKAEARAKELDDKHKGDFSSISTYELNKPNGWEA